VQYGVIRSTGTHIISLSLDASTLSMVPNLQAHHTQKKDSMVGAGSCTNTPHFSLSFQCIIHEQTLPVILMPVILMPVILMPGILMPGILMLCILLLSNNTAMKHKQYTTRKACGGLGCANVFMRSAPPDH
jgi:hypothetical protein